MITVLIGHRGVGKTTFLKKIGATQSLSVIDLDQYLEILHGNPIGDLISHGIDQFREMEIEAFQKIVTEIEKPTVISVGAGFMGEVPEDARVVWLRRSTDRDGRIFLNRPRLTNIESPFEEFKSLFEVREERYRELATEVLQLPEGYEGGLEGFFSDKPHGHLNADLTLFSHQLNEQFIQKRLALGVRHLELRTDLLNAHELAWAFSNIPAKKILYAIRTEEFPEPPQGVTIDWPLEFGAPKINVDILSCHERDAKLNSTLEKLDHRKGILKLAIEINSFAELLEGHQWWEKDPKHRAFLPRSKNGRWQWYRSLNGPDMPVHFIREDEGSSLDQPFLWQATLQTPFKGRFAAVLGSPVHHSRTPMEHLEFFRQRGMPVVAVDIFESEFNDGIEVLHKLGLHFAAVTSPLKKLAAELCHEIENLKIGSVNTLARNKTHWYGTNTDVYGLEALKDYVPDGKKVGLWGGGGTRAAVESVFQEISTYSARRGAGNRTAPAVLLWAVGRNREFQWPPREWQLQMVVDLNYTENSPGLELAAQRHIPYVSGLVMFKAQAEGQRRFWHRFL